MRLDKFLAGAGLGNRKEVRIYIQDGLIKVNGKILREPAVNINEKIDSVEYLDKVVKNREKIYYMFHKPGGCVTARSDYHSKTVLDYFNGVNMDGVFHVGRLDKDTEGLLLLTNDGDFNHNLMCPENHVTKTYFFWALGYLNDEDIIKIENGISIDKGETITKPAKIEIDTIGTYESLKKELEVVKYYDMKSNHNNQAVVSGYLTISEGRKHQVKRMLKAVGCYVVYLKRISIGELNLDEKLEEGQYRLLESHEINILCNT